MRTIATQQLDISVYPEFLIIVVSRQIGNTKEIENNINMVNTAVEFPLEDLCFSTISNIQEQLVVDLLYNLIAGTVNHKARKKGGH